MSHVWRISAHNDLSGLGGERSDGRWHTSARGKRIVYLSEHPALALLEALVNLKGNPKFFPESYQLMKVNVPDHFFESAEKTEAPADNWQENFVYTRALGDQWLAGNSSAFMIVPSAPSPESFNYLFNPKHPNAAMVTIESAKRVKYDKRLFLYQATQSDTGR